MTVLQEKAMLVNLSISAWTASKKDNKAGESVKAQASATAKAGWFNKRLIDPSALDKLNKIEGRARDVHYRMTLPWGDNGDRILPAQAYMDYMDAIRVIRAEHDTARTEFVRDYPALVQGARQMLGAMYDPGDYPDVDRVAEKFDIRLGFTPVPDASDFRVDVGDEAVAEIRKSITESVEKRLHGATRECWIRLDGAVKAMVIKLSDPEAVFRDSLVENLRVLTDVLPKLNITNDAKLNDVLGSVKTWLLVDTESLRKDKKFRLFTADKAAEILAEIGPWVKTEAF